MFLRLLVALFALLALSVSSSPIPCDSLSPTPTPTPTPTDDCSEPAPSHHRSAAPTTSPVVPTTVPTTSPVAPTTTPTTGPVAPTTTPTTSPVAPTTSPAAPTTTSVVPPPSTTSSTPSSDASNGPFSGGIATYFYQNGNPGACGQYHSDSDFIAAMDQARFGTGSSNSPLCNQRVQITNVANGITITVTIVDDCPTCENSNSIDLSVAAFQALSNNDLGLGVLNIVWSYVS